MMKNQILEQIIIDYHEEGVPDGIKKRSLIWETLTDKVNTLIGMRRVGKTWLCYDRIQELLAVGLPIERTLFIDFEDERLWGLELSDLDVVLQTYFKLYPENQDKKIYLFFDEIQNIPGWERFVRRIVKQKKIEVYITGSSAKLLSKEIATSLRGRALAKELYPLSFPEYLGFCGISDYKKVSSAKRNHLIHHFYQFMEKGGFPEVLELSENMRTRVLQDYFNSVVYRDVIERHQVSNTNALRTLCKHSINNAGQSVSINKLYNELRSQQIKTSKDLLYDYLNYLEDAYCIFTHRIYSDSVRKQQLNPPKIYLIDHAFGKANASKISADKGRHLENLVFIDLKRQGIESAYYKSSKVAEIDFIWQEKDGVHLIQVCWSLEDSHTRSREVDSLLTAINELEATNKVKSATIITAEEQQVEEKYQILPYWKWSIIQMG